MVDGKPRQTALPIHKREGAEQRVQPQFALWALGFRPFYLVASLFAALSILIWVGEYAGALPDIYHHDPVWHAHEMLYGYTVAVIVGFLFTAGRNWTGQPTPTGARLAALVLLWIAGRVLILTPYTIAAAFVNTVFPIAAGVALAVPLVRGGNRRNYFFVVLLMLMACATLAVHLAHAGVIAWPARLGVHFGLDVVLLIMAVMGGRVIPMFTNNGIPGLQATRKPIIEKGGLGIVLVLLASDLLQLAPSLVAAISLTAAVIHAARLFLWQPWRTGVNALVWILHAGYAWIVLYLALRGLAALGYVGEPIAVHALTIGAIGSLTIGMMTRTAKGHTGRALQASAVEVFAYVLVQLAAIVRVFGGMFFSSAYLWTVIVSGLCWSIAFGVYAVVYWPILSRPRLDGKPG